MKANRYKVNRGEPGANIITLLKDGVPAIKNPPAIVAPSPSLLPAVAGDQNEGKAIVLSRYDKIANLRFTLIGTLSKEAAKECGPKVKIIDKLLALFNGGLLLPGVLKELGPISQRTFYRFLETFNDKGIEGLAPQYGRNGRKPFTQITTDEKSFLKNLFDQNRPKIADAIRDCKRYLGKSSISSPSTLRRYVNNNFIRDNYDVWILDREGEKAWNDKVAPYQDRDAMRLDVGYTLVADGHKLNADILDPVTGKKSDQPLFFFGIGKALILWVSESHLVKIFNASGKLSIMPFWNLGKYLQKYI